MTIETGVVAGNFNRVAAELAAMLVDIRVKTAVDKNTIAVYETKLEALKLRAESFLQSVDGEDSSDTIQSIMGTSQASVPEPRSLAEALKTKESMKVDEVESPTNLDEDLSNDEPFSEPTVQPVELPTSEIMDKLNELAVNQEKILMMLENLSLSATNNESELKAAEQVASEDNINSIEDYLEAATTIDLLSLDNRMEHFDDLVQSVCASPVKNVALVMSSLQDKVMERSRFLHELFSCLSTNQVFNPDQKNVLEHLALYHERMLANADKAPLPSPWERGMKELFA